MSQVSEILKVRQSLIQELARTAATERRVYLESLFRDVNGQGRESLAKAKLAFAHVLWVREGFHQDFNDGKRHLLAAIAVCDDLREQNRLLAFLRRDLDIFLGNFYLQHRETKAAVKSYQEAIRHEQNPDRKALGLMNVARAFMNEGNFYKALATAGKIDLGQVREGRLQDYVILLKARIFFTLGYEDKCLAQVAPLLTDAPVDRQIDLEARYLTLHSQMDFSQLAVFGEAYARFVDGFAASDASAAHDFYKLEWLAYAPLVQPKSLTNRRAYLDRARYLAKRLGHAEFYGLIEHIVAFCMAKAADEDLFQSLCERLLAIYQEGHHRLGQCLFLLVANVAVDRRQFGKAWQLLAEFDVQMEKLGSGFTQKLAHHFVGEKSRLRAYAQHLQERIPKTQREKQKTVGSLLFEGE